MDTHMLDGSSSIFRYNDLHLPGGSTQSSCRGDPSPKSSPADSHYGPSCVGQFHGSEYQDQHAYYAGTGVTQHYSSPHLQHAWFASSPSASGGESDHYSLNGSSTNYNPSPLSPRGWNSDQAVWASPVDHIHHHQQHHPSHFANGLRICPPLAFDGLPAMTDYRYPLHGFRAEANAQASPSMPAESLSSCSPSPHEPVRVAPCAAMDAKMDPDVEFESPQPASPGVDAGDEKEMAKGDEPYAQLIYRAFMSRADHAMTLQEIYQWFRENTEKAKNGHKGWQNSIRHNLSMNQAFVKRDKPQEAGTTCTPANPPSATPIDSKKSTEWVLEPWAITEGVQSTTRYRKGNGSKRGRNSPSRPQRPSFHPDPQHPQRLIPGRAISGRRGGVQAKTRSKYPREKRGGRSVDETTHLHFDIKVEPGEHQDRYQHQQHQQHQQHHMCDQARRSPDGGALQQQHQLVYDLSHFSLGDVNGVFPGGRLFEGDGIMYGWGGGGEGHGHGSPTM